MSRIMWIILGILLLGTAVWQMLPFQSSSRPQVRPMKNAVAEQRGATVSSYHSGTPSISIRDDDLVVRVEQNVDLHALGIDPEPFKEVTNDPAVILILTSHAQQKDVGILKTVSSNEMELKLEDGRSFKAAHIGRRRTQADDGTVVLDAVTTPNGKPMAGANTGNGEGPTRGDPGEIWTLSAAGIAQRVSPVGVHAMDPVISPDGRYVAFTGQYLINGDVSSKVLLIKDLHRGGISSYGLRQYGLDYQISAVDWIEGGKILRVLDDWGETGGHLQLKQIRVD